jgi:hypothetical protein
MGRTGVENGQSTPAASGWSAVGTVTAYAAAIVALAYALMSLYWALGGHALVSTIGGYVEQFALRGRGTSRAGSPRGDVGKRWLVVCSRWRWCVPGGG